MTALPAGITRTVVPVCLSEKMELCASARGRPTKGVRAGEVLEEDPKERRDRKSVV